MHRNLSFTCLVIAMSVLSVDVRAQDDNRRALEHFETRIRPILVNTCFRCHGGDTTSQGLRVDSRQGLLTGGERGPAIIPEKPDDSWLLKAIQRGDPDLQMPPDDPLPQHVVDDFRQWIRDGAVWPEYPATENGGDPAFVHQEHWAFQPLRIVTPPADVSGWSHQSLDAFIAAKHQQMGLNPVALADRRTLIRRLYFDLLGLPPSDQQMEAALSDSSPDAWPRLVDQLLESPHYGERWGRFWMDVVHYADTAGDNADYPIPEAHLYRDYIIDAFNADKPYNQFIREQLAGDILATNAPRQQYAELISATGFLALSRRYATAPYEFWHLTLEDTIDTVGQSFLGLTLKCARCHDHKFDPISTADYYALYGIFESTQFPWAGAEEFQSKNFPRQHFVPLAPDAEVASQMQAFELQRAALSDQVKELEERLTKCEENERPALQKQLDETRAAQRAFQRAGLPSDVPGAYAVRDGAVHDAAIQHRGDPGQPGPVIHRGGPERIHHGRDLGIGEHESGRRQLADWIADPQNPLTARVMVNRLWQHHFGRGLVETPSNFGVRGTVPTHPELLDYLAHRFIESGWSIKAMHRVILTSKTWQLSCDSHERNERVDTGNSFYWRHDRQRLDAEAIRDALLLVSGRLDLSRAGAHQFPPMIDWHWTQHNQFKDVYASNHRSVYLMTQRIQRHPFLALFDGPDTNASTARRSSSTVPQQALYLMNSDDVRQIATAFAGQMFREASDVRSRVDYAHRRCYARPATERDVVAAEKYVAAFTTEAANSTIPEDGRELAAWTSYARILLTANEFLYID
jgi:cytochrome c553